MLKTEDMHLGIAFVLLLSIVDTSIPMANDRVNLFVRVLIFDCSRINHGNSSTSISVQAGL